jgi:hypothetical protein
MKSFLNYLIEQYDEESGASRQIKHLSQIEDKPFHTGEKGALHSIKVLSDVATHILNGEKTSQLKTKYDGSPSIVYGYHPEKKKFFVAEKGAFNKTPKINYTSQDVEKNHGHTPELASKLKDTLSHLPKIAPKEGVYQGDILFTDGDKKVKNDSVSFKSGSPGIKYIANGSNADKAKKSKIGIVTHVSYQGDNAGSLNASHEVDHENFGTHKDVMHVDPRMDTAKVHFGPKYRAEFNKHLSDAKKMHDTHGNQMYDGTSDHHGIKGDLQNFITHSSDNGIELNHSNFRKWLEQYKNKELGKIKNEKNKPKAQEELKNELSKLDRNKRHYDNLFKMHKHLQKAKDVLVDVLDQHQEFQHEHFGETKTPEGYIFYNGKNGDLFSKRKLTGRNT